MRPTLLVAIVPLLLLTACGGRTPEPEVVEAPPAADEPSPEELAAMHAELREKATQVVEDGGIGRLDVDDGKRELRVEGIGSETVAFEGGRMQGELQRSYADGQQERQAAYEKGLKEGPYKSWYANGQIFQEGNFKADQKHGRWTTYYEDGTILEQVEYRGGRRIGTYVAKLPDGTTIVDMDVPRNP